MTSGQVTEWGGAGMFRNPKVTRSERYLRMWETADS